MGAALAYYAIFSLAPLVILVLSLVSMAFKRDYARERLIAQVADLLGQQGADTVEAILANTSSGDAGIWAAAIGFIALLVGASGVFGELQDSLNQIWEIPEKQGRRWTDVLKDRFLSFAMILVIGFLLLVSLLLSAALAAANKFMDGLLPGAEVLWAAGNFAVSLLVITLLFAMIFRVLPDARITWKDVWLGAVLTALLFVIGKFFLGLYLGHSAVASSYGAAGSLIAILLWVFYAAQILFFGAEFTRVYALHYGSHRSRGRAAPGARF